MNKLKILVIAIYLLGICSSGNSQPVEMTLPTGKMTLKMAYEIAMKNNPGIKQSLEAVKQAVFRARQAQSSLQPSLGLSGNLMQHNATTQPDWAPDVRLNESFNTYNVQLNFNYLIYDGFERRANILAAENAIKQTEQLHFEVRILLLEAVSGSFMQALLAAENMKIEKSNFEFNQKLETESQIRWKVGDLPESEALNFSLRKIQAEAGYISAQRDFSIACIVLAELLALPEAKLPAELYPSLEIKEVDQSELDEKKEIDYALKHRPDLEALNYSIKSVCYQKKAVRGSYSPKLSLISGLNYDSTVDFMNIEQHENSSFVGVQANFDIYKNGRRKAQIKEFESVISSQRQIQNKTILNIQSKVQQQICQVKSSLLLLNKQKQALEMSRKIREHVQKLYSAGETNLTRLNEAQNDLIKISGSVAASQIAHQLMLILLDSTTGKILEGFKPKGQQKIGRYQIISMD